MSCASQTQLSRHQTGATGSFTAIARDSSGDYSTNTSSVNVILTNSLYGYDLNGNLTNDGFKSFAYDDENELIAVWVTNAWSNSFAYDGKMRRRIERDYSWNAGNTGWTETNEAHFIYDGNVVVEERNASDVPLVSYTRGLDLNGSLQDAGGIGGLLARTTYGQELPGAPTTAFYHADGNGNITALMYPNQQLAAKYLYDPFGNMLAMSGPLMNFNKYRFSSKEWNDNAGLYYYGYRFYDPNLQRWATRDPNGEPGFSVIQSLADSEASQAKNTLEFAILGMNPFLFVDNNALVFVDADGLFWAQIGNGLRNTWNWVEKHLPPWNAPPSFPPGGALNPWGPPGVPGKHGTSCGIAYTWHTNSPPTIPQDPQGRPWDDPYHPRVPIGPIGSWGPVGH